VVGTGGPGCQWVGGPWTRSVLSDWRRL
jgi:hypothetical protein